MDLTLLIDHPVAGTACYRRTRTRGCLRVPYAPLRPTATLLPAQCNRGSLRFGRNIGRARNGAPVCCLGGGLEGEHRLRGLGENRPRRQACSWRCGTVHDVRALVRSYGTNIPRSFLLQAIFFRATEVPPRSRNLHYHTWSNAHVRRNSSTRHICTATAWERWHS